MVTLQTGQSINIFQRKEHLDHITFHEHLVLDERFRSDLERLGTEAQYSLVSEINRDVLLTGVELEGLVIPIGELHLYAYTYFDGLTKNSFMQRILLVLRALSLSAQPLIRGLVDARRPTDALPIQLRLVPLRGDGSEVPRSLTLAS